MGLICIGNWKVSSFPLHSLSQFLFLLHLFLTTYEANEFSISFLGLKSNTHTFHFSPLRLLLNSQPPAPRLDVGVFSQFFVVVGIFLVFISFSYNLAIENISFSDSHPHKMLQIVPTMRSCCCCCFFAVSFFFLFCCGFSVYASHTHTYTHAQRVTAAPRI